MIATVHSGESIPVIAGDVVVHVVRELVRGLYAVEWATLRQGRETVEIATREQIEDFLRGGGLHDAALNVVATARLREHVQEVAR